jgi:hypothetical protein
MTGYCPAGLPHSDIPGSKPACGSPRLFAACHVLRRLSAPRHPPCTLSSLTILELHTCSRRILSLLTRFSCQGTLDLWDPRFLRAAARRNRTSQTSRATLLSVPLVFQQRTPAFHSTTGLGLREAGGADRVRTDDLRLARAALSQLSYSPVVPERAAVVGLGRFELPTSRLSGVRSNQLSYRPEAGNHADSLETRQRVRGADRPKGLGQAPKLRRAPGRLCL